MELSSRSSQQPEEIVRQNLIAKMSGDLHFPPSLISVEVELSKLPHLVSIKKDVPKRRADIICFAPNIHPSFELYPLLLIECKAVKITNKVINQVTGYNHYVKACFIAVVNQEEIRTGWFDRDKTEYSFIPFLPSYKELISAVTRISHK